MIMKDTSCKTSRWRLLKARLNNLEPKDFRQKLEEADTPVVLDVRTAAEYQQGSICGARHLDYLADGFLEELEKLNPQQPTFVLCRTGRRSIRVCTLMQNAGFQQVYNLEGGLKAWQAEES